MAKNILVCDDAAFMRMMIKDILSKNGYNVAGEAENGLKAVEKYKEVSPDLVLMDITMPEMNGLEACKILVGELGVPVVIYSDDLSIKSEVLAAGAAFEKKPSLSSFDEVVLKDVTIRIHSTIEKIKNSSERKNSKKNIIT